MRLRKGQGPRVWAHVGFHADWSVFKKVNGRIREPYGKLAGTGQAGEGGFLKGGRVPPCPPQR